MTPADIVATLYGSVALVRPVSPEAQRWVDENVYSESWQWVGAALAVEPRYLDNLLSGAASDGLTCEVEQ